MCPVFATLAPTLKSQAELRREARLQELWNQAEKAARIYQARIDQWCRLYDLGLKKQAKKLELKLRVAREIARLFIEATQKAEAGVGSGLRITSFEYV